MEKKILGLTPVSEDELNDYYGGGTGASCICPGGKEGEPGPYNKNCCWHDCKNPITGQGSKFANAGY